MLKNIPNNLSPKLLKILMEMGHADEIIIGDGNFPAASNAKNLVRCDGLGVAELLESILQLFPTDTHSEYGFGVMQVMPGDDVVPVIWDTYRDIINAARTENPNIEQIERFEFYERAKKAYAIIATSEEALYANILLKKGVVKT